MEYRAAQTAAVAITFAVLGTIFVFLRLWTRFVIIRAAGPEDGVLVFSWICTMLFMVCVSLQIHYGLGKHAKTLSTHEAEQLSLYFYISICVYCASLGLTKLAILMQYRRVFQTPRFQIWNWVVIAIIIGFLIGTVGAAIFICTPVQKFWKTELEGHCINKSASWLANAVMSVITDLMIIILPMPVIRRLQLKPTQKYLLMGIFAFGAIVCVISVLRMHSLIIIARSTDPSYDNTTAASFSAVEAWVAIICACLPTLRPLLSQWFSGLGSSAHESANIDTNVMYGTDGGSLHVEEMLRSRDTKKSGRRSSLPWSEFMPVKAIPEGKKGVERSSKSGRTYVDQRERLERERVGNITVETTVDITVGDVGDAKKGKWFNRRQDSTESLFRDPMYGV
ncbi:hypothetical protein DM02DRAFT_663536 [Periconia macrospinosa]|uniref:Rhodopsin domain-containing protein n=1 Tax=Periconia macrospinosa TaxID=97972 RepID=A0A2V1D1E7_9PLEO|nr:hypothetical protein DM02DRAFT_663536 [Periconia macrospinosa]